MDKQIQKLKSYLDQYLGKSSEYILQKLGMPETYYENDEVLFYEKKKYGIFKDEIALFLKNDKVEDIAITEYVFGIAVRNIFYYQKESPEFKVSNILFKYNYETR